jgi:hypothetical protein
VAVDTSLDHVAEAARTRDWNAFPRLVPLGDSTDFLELAGMPSGSTLFAPLQGLQRRAAARLVVGDTAGALGDLRALVGLGDRILAHDPRQGAAAAGLVAIHGAVLLLDSIPAVNREERVSAALDSLHSWVRVQPSMEAHPLLLQAVPDSAFALASEARLTLGWRTFALYAYLTSHLFSSHGILLGMTRPALDSLQSLASDANSEFDVLARAALHTARLWNSRSPLGRWHVWQRWTPTRTRSH